LVGLILATAAGVIGARKRILESSHWRNRSEFTLWSAQQQFVHFVANSHFPPILLKNNVLLAQKVWSE